MFLSYRNHSITFHSKSVDWFLYERNISHRRLGLTVVKLICNGYESEYVFLEGTQKVNARWVNLKELVV